ncbi:MAG TPA: GNAT family N-acetyltransferase [Candidatus Saccharimonadales bacterium]|nr:GNAT family N-acetyltransferase [Candidatus Saccharimonadales bacterium]
MDNSTIPAALAFREATLEDIPEMLEVVNAAFQEEAFFVNRPRTYRAQLEEHFRSGQFLLAHRGSQLLASAYCEIRGARGYIGMLAVRPGHQREGLGRAMMYAVEQILRSHGCSVAEISVVSVRTALPPIYRRLGYAEVGVEEPHEDLRKKLTMPVQLIKMEKEL